MKTDVKGCSTTTNGTENYEQFYSSIAKKQLFQYDFRTKDGELFSCVSTSIEKCREKRDYWLLTK
jgi:hypothetical protein